MITGTASDYIKFVTQALCFNWFCASSKERIIPVQLLVSYVRFEGTVCVPNERKINIILKMIEIQSHAPYHFISDVRLIKDSPAPIQNPVMSFL